MSLEDSLNRRRVDATKPSEEVQDLASEPMERPMDGIGFAPSSYDVSRDENHKQPKMTAVEVAKQVLRETQEKAAEKQRRFGTKVDEVPPWKREHYDRPKPDPVKYQEEQDRRHP